MSEQHPDPRPVLDRATEQLAGLVAAVDPEQLTAPTPCGDFDVRSLLGHLVGGMDRMAAIAAGGDTAYEEVPAWAPGLPAEEWPRVYAEARGRMTGAWADDALLDATVAVPWGTMPGRAALAGTVLEVVVHSWDLATATSRTDGLDPELGRFALAVAERAVPDDGRAHLPFAPRRPVPDDAGVYTRLAAWLGREPGPSAPA
ncbi:TIGR03086 family metal-binding protein [Streptomyces sp. HNM0574]|uniref:TIGR03086 family metal-binding protein n=1 Tax=Streptomyces sp. HNM0574 TaxID=2714954 RepID=UPI00146AF252|nr:TIGR03086 family protein [Streptomyces sp. HNM0574]